MADHATPLRLDRLLTLGVAAPLRRMRPPVERPRCLRVLMYHGISDVRDVQRHPYFRTVTSPARFASHMEFLLAAGHTTMTLDDGLAWLRGEPAPDDDTRDPVVVTFDDGLRDFRTAAHPVLARLGIPATVFLTTGFLDGRFLNGEDCLRTTDVAALAAAGVAFGSHTVTHRRLVDLDDAALAHELRASRQAIESIVSAPVTLFSYPYRFPEDDPGFVRRLQRGLADSGYLGGVTTVIGRAIPADDPLFLRRLPVNDDDDLALFAAKLDGSYDWLHAVQIGRKQLRRWLPTRRRA